jgi:hypothetical protein
MSNNDDEPLELANPPVEQGVSGADATEQLAQSPEDNRNFTETHPEKARRERLGEGVQASEADERLVGAGPIALIVNVAMPVTVLSGLVPALHLRLGTSAL